MLAQADACARAVFSYVGISGRLRQVREEKELPNPATYTFDTKLDFPFDQTILPIAKRKLMWAISQ